MNNTGHYLHQACLVDLGRFVDAASLSAELLTLDATFRGHQTVPGGIQSSINGRSVKVKSGIDARHFGNQSRFANHYKGIARRPNANIVSNLPSQKTLGEDPFLALQARSDISAGSEILVSLSPSLSFTHACVGTTHIHCLSLLSSLPITLPTNPHTHTHTHTRAHTHTNMSHTHTHTHTVCLFACCLIVHVPLCPFTRAAGELRNRLR
jgi:hypothetical protein